MRVSELLVGLKAISDARPNDTPLRNAVKLLERRVTGHEDMALEDFLRLFRKSPPPGPAPQVSVAKLVGRLQSALTNDDTFDATLSEVSKTKGVTKPVLTQIYYDLFERHDGVPSKATKAELVRLIADERLILVRNNKMGKLLGRRMVPAE